MANRKELKVGDYVSSWGFDFTPPTWWERILWSPRWYWNDLSYWLRKQGQRLRDGFPSEESFDFYSHCAKWSLPRLKQLRNNLHGHPINFMDEADDQNSTNQYFFSFMCSIEPKPTPHEKWESILDKIIWSMENFDKDVDPIYPPNWDDRQVVTEVSDKGITFKRADERNVDWSPVTDHERRVQAGFELFGKYFQNLWD